MKKNILRKICLLCSLIGVGCLTAACNGMTGGDSSSEPEKTITISADWSKDTAETVGYGETYTLDYLVTDTEGGIYAATAVVKDSKGAEVKVLNGKFVVTDKAGYTIEYSFTTGGKTYTRKVTLAVSAEALPIVEVQGRDTLVYLGEAYTVPVCEASDYYDGKLTPVIELYRTSDDGDEKLDYTPVGGDAFTPTETGEYYVSYKAENSAKKSTEKRVYFYVWKNLLSGDEALTEEIVSVGAESYKKIYNNDITSSSAYSYVEAGAEEIAAFTGGYTGDATKIKLETNPNYRLRNEYTPKDLAEISKTYNSVSLWFAVDGIVDDKTYLMAEDTFQNKAMKGMKALTAADNGKWLRWTVSLKDYIELLETFNYEYCKLLYNWIDGAQLGEGRDEAYFYFGDVEFFYQPPTVVKITDSNYTTIGNPDVKSSYVSAAELAALNIEGEYVGNATRFTATNALTNGGYRVFNAYSEAELKEIATKFNTVTAWVAATGITSASLNINSTVKNNFAYEAGVQGFTTTAKWQRLSISIDKYIQLLKATNYAYCPLLATANWSAVGVDTNGLYLYFGDISFSYEQPTIVKVTDVTYSKIYNKDIACSYAGASELTTFTGGYTGNASVMKLVGNAGYRFANPYTLEQLAELKQTYNSVSVWVAVDGIASGVVYLNQASATTTNYFVLSAHDGKGTTLRAEDNKVWKKWTISMDAYIELVTTVTETDGASVASAADNCLLTGAYTAESTSIEDAGLKLYVGDVFFENVTAE